jgi:hypothetical protein
MVERKVSVPIAFTWTIQAVCATAYVVGALTSDRCAAADRPNILLIMADDLAYSETYYLLPLR